MPKQIKLEIANEHPETGQWVYAELELPAEEYEIRDAFQRARITDADTYHEYSIYECEAIPMLPFRRLDSPTIDELNFLAQRLDSLNEDEQLVLRAVSPKILKVGEDELVSPKDLINLTYGLENVSIISNVSNPQQLGQFVIENDMHTDVEAVPEDSLYLLDKMKIGQLQQQNDGGVFMDGDYIVAGEYQLPKVYDGQQLPQSDVSTWYAFRLEVTHPPIYEDDELNSKTVWLSLPATEDEVKAVTDELGMGDIRSCVYYGFESSVPQIESDHFGDMQDFDSLNSLAEMMVEMTPADQVKFKAVLSAEEPSKIEDILDIARNLHQYEHAYMVNDSADFFKDYMLRHMDSRMDSHWFDTLLTRNEGDRLLSRLGATATDYGVISARGRSLYELVPYEEQQTEQEQTEDQDEDLEQDQGIQRLTMK